MPQTYKRVAIAQPWIILGGRLKVILGMVHTLNQLGITPDILTTRLHFNPEEIVKRYGQPLNAHFRLLSRPPKGLAHQDAATLWFNHKLKAHAGEYDLIINTSNCVQMLPNDMDVLSYMFFPRKYRLLSDDFDIHRPDYKPSLLRRKRWARVIMRPILQYASPSHRHHVICMTQFTCHALHEVYPDLPVIDTIYPPVDIEKFWSEGSNRKPAIISVGRFSPTKRQLQQIELAAKLPDFEFHIIGFAPPNHPYFLQCQDLVRKLHLRNVHLHPNAPFETLLGFLQSSRYFLHTMIKEPFGITAVQAMAAGCVPLVHDSGGQRETVPLPELRYTTLEEVPEKLSILESLTTSQLNSIRQRLQMHVRQFSETQFYERMNSVLASLL